MSAPGENIEKDLKKLSAPQRRSFEDVMVLAYARAKANAETQTIGVQKIHNGVPLTPLRINEAIARLLDRGCFRSSDFYNGTERVVTAHHRSDLLVQVAKIEVTELGSKFFKALEGPYVFAGVDFESATFYWNWEKS